MSIAHSAAALVIGGGLAVAAHAATDHFSSPDFPAWQPVLDRLKTEEGFRGTCYTDTRGNPTIAYGIKLPLTKPEGLLLAGGRLSEKHDRLVDAWPAYADQPEDVQGALLDMAFEEGVHGLLGFHDMLAALERGDRAAAASAALDSVWAREEAPNRARELAAIIRGEN